MPGAIATLLLAALPLLAGYLYVELRRIRYRQFADIPSPPTSLLWGHGKAIADAYAKGDIRRHSDYVFHEIAKTLGVPPMVMFDLRPFYWAICVITSHEVAEQVSRPSKLHPYSTPKSPTMRQLDPLIGEHALIHRQGEEWKSLRKRYNAGFAPQHLMTLLPQIMDKTKQFVARLDNLARKGEEFGLDGLCIDLTFDIIGAVTMDVDLDAQRPREEQSEIVRYYRDLTTSYTADGNEMGFTFNLKTLWQRRKLARLADQAIKDAVRQKFQEIQESEETQKTRSVLALSLRDVKELTPHVLQVTADQIKSFLFAGHDTTSIMLQWTFYELSRSPKVMAKLRAELYSVFGPATDYESMAEILVSRGEWAINQLTYTSAIIKEILRLYPPAGSARRVPYGDGFFVTLPDGKEVCLDGVVLYNCQYMIHRDPAIYGETKDDFVPERWLDDLNTSADDDVPEKHGSGEGKVPASAWRPFERGPRNCIGQELANLEARVIIATAVHRYDFVKVGTGELRRDEDGKLVVNAKGQYEVEHELFNTRQVTAKPVDGMRMRVGFHQDQS
ncbi:uncharacterized protein K452DRAFT_340986 [Aplosporella prunicola CBS 121167]|uniref:Cytochrome P450 52A11 n=1 Tax=Aplosporella prunicola CBS 121167 TaxID=1176127 RepID=A0A6A6BUK3_9PEZI|nr:uncharacterized protein K452DRAFT_340986 [Aplosporella prunicola CBS 121167]KAF2146341.1 hypothetical protein K452DRAFT_340986 [Aplosporella prunicola CBS 121167]